jgi:WD40 repeat protein
MPLPGPTLWLAAALAFIPADDGTPTYERDLLPILVERCTGCHNRIDREDLDASGGLSLDSFEATLKGTNKRKVVKPGKSSESPLFLRVVDPDDDRRMPPDEEQLDLATRELIRRWIDAGAPRGEPVKMIKPAVAKSPARSVVRSVDVAIPLPPPSSKEGPTEIRLKVGPLPAVSSIAFAADGSTLAVGTYGQITLWDLAKREPIRVLDDLPGPVLALAFGPDGKALAAGAGLPARSGVIRLYAMPEGKPLRTFEGHRDVVAGLAFRPDGQVLASASYDTTVRTWEVDTGKPLGIFKGHSDFVYDVAYLPDGKSLLTASKDRTVKRIDAAKMTELRTYGEHNDDVLALAVRPDGSGFVSAGNEPQVRSWGLEAEKSAKRVGAHSGPVHQLAFSRDGKRLASASGDKSIRIFNGSDLAPIRSLPGPAEWQYAVALSTDGRRVAGGGWDGVVRVWDADAPKLDAIVLQPPMLSPGQPSWLAVGPDGTVNASSDLWGEIRWVIGGKESKERPAKPEDEAKPKKPAEDRR